MRKDLNPRERESYKDSTLAEGAPEKPLFGNTFTRRRFLKRAGGATAATMLALHGMRVEVLAQSGSAWKRRKIEETWVMDLKTAPYFVEPTPAQQQGQKDSWEMQHPQNGANPAGANSTDRDYRLIDPANNVPSSSFENGDSIDMTFATSQATDGKWYMTATLTIVETISWEAP